MDQLIALLRGINLGSKRRIAMADLRALLETRGYREVRTLLQSGNVIVSSGQSPGEAETAIAAAIEAEFEMAVDVVVRTGAEFAEIVANDPFAGVATNPKAYHVAFCAATVDPQALKAVEAAGVEPERIVARGRDAYLWLANGVMDSKLLKVLDKQPLAPSATLRNWNTVTKLLEKLQDA